MPGLRSSGHPRSQLPSKPEQDVIRGVATRVVRIVNVDVNPLILLGDHSAEFELLSIARLHDLLSCCPE